MDGYGSKQRVADGLQGKGLSIGAPRGTRVRVVRIRNDFDAWRRP